MSNVLIKGYQKIEENFLFDDYYFIEYVLAESKKQLGRMLGQFQYNLPGGVTINFDMLRSEGDERLKEVKQEIKDNTQPDFFLTFH